MVLFVLVYYCSNWAREFRVAPSVCGFFCVNSLLCGGAVCVPFSLAIFSLRKRELVALLIVFMLLCCLICLCSSISLPLGTKGWSVIFDCGIS